MDRSSIQITDAEWAVMEAVWAAESQAAGDVITRVKQTKDWNHRTIRTLLARLVEKGAVDVQIEGNKHLYRAAVSKQECVRSAARSFSERFFAGDVKSLLLHFVEHEEISADELQELQRTIEGLQPPSRKGKQSSRSKRRKGP